MNCLAPWIVGMTIYLPPELIAKKVGIIVPPDKSHHLLTVMRCKAGDEFDVIDGHGQSYLARISGIRKKEVTADILREEALEAESQVRLILCQGILKGEKMDFVIRKATELGVSEIVPVVSERCQVKETRKTLRWRKIAEEAAEQCGRPVIPVIDEPQTFARSIERFAEGKVPAGLVFWEGGGLPPDEALEKTAFHGELSHEALLLFVGPEGGFAPSEVEAAESRGFVRSTLGKRILRAETAAIAAITLVQFLAEKRSRNQRKV